MSDQPYLVVFSGRPGTGKTTVSRMLAIRWKAAWLRIDALEQAIRTSGVREVGASGYAAAQAAAAGNLALGLSVVVDCVNPVQASRDGWHDVARRVPATIADIELVCSDLLQHRHRIETRQSDVPGLAAPDWAAVSAHDYAPWSGSRLVLDTAALSPDAAVRQIVQHLAALDSGVRAST